MNYDSTAAADRRKIRFLSALRRVRKTGSPAARAELRDARLDCEAHGELVDEYPEEQS